MLKILTFKVSNMQSQMYYFRREMENIRKNQREMLQVKHIETEMLNAFNGLIDQHSQEKTSELEDRKYKFPKLIHKEKNKALNKALIHDL